MRIGLDALRRAMEEPCRIEAVLYARPSAAGPTWTRSYLKSPRLPVAHIEHCFADRFDRLAPLPAARAADYDTCLHWPTGYPEGAQRLINLLKEVLVLPTEDDHLDLAVTLDWYKILDPTVASTDWENTVAGGLVQKAKYWVSNPRIQRASANRLIELLSEVVERHPALRAAPFVVSVPGSKGDGNSVGEYIAAGVAEQAGKTLISTTGPAREPRKGGGAAVGLDGQFVLPAMVEGACIVVDDVYKSGMTMRATALAARKAGATAVYGIAAAKTISG
ncbi:phosphoribosyltransferase [Mycobacterium sp. SMC-18]|uniref:phosphoribosyltransferase n=1 Tax=Mycobacterium TaxID=1763 RepID=UPI00115C3406|nr:phosphoribosyltransferase [Mycobacterium kansasii]